MLHQKIAPSFLCSYGNIKYHGLWKISAEENKFYQEADIITLSVPLGWHFALILNNMIQIHP